MRFLPIFLDLSAGSVLVVGAGEPARAKLRLLSAAGARVRFHATDGDFDLGELDAAVRTRVEISRRDPLQADLAGVIAILCAGAGETGIAMAARARSVGLPVNVMDDLEHSSFIVPAIVDRGKVVVAIGTEGSSPVVARRVRERIEALLPARIGELAEFIGRFRKSIHSRIAEFALRRRFWERVVDGPIGALVLDGRGKEAEQALLQISDPTAFARADHGQGQVVVVGTGPGDPDLLTIKALRALQDADVVVHSETAPPGILDRVRRDARRIPVRDSETPIRQLIELARSGHRIVWLKEGDGVFDGASPDFETIRKVGTACSLVPGIAARLGDARASEDGSSVRPMTSSNDSNLVKAAE